MNHLGHQAVVSPTKLTRACQACVKAKRKCSLDLPACDRCRTRELECNYRNEPLSGHKVQGPCQTTSKKCVVEELASSDFVFPSSQLSLFRRVAEPKCIIPVDSDTIAFMRRLAKKHVLNYGTRGGNVFIHEEIARSQLGMNLKAICQQSTNIASRSQKSQIKIYEQLDYLVGSMVIKAGLAPNLCEMLFLVQSLILVQIVSLLVLNGSVAYKRQAEKRQYVLHLWTGKLWNMAPSELPASLSPRQAFLLAESVRRTIIISGEFQGLWHASKYAWVEHNMFLDSLPFERRAQLWEVPETGFDTAFGNGKQDIISWRELIDIFDAGMLSTFTSFETMLLVALRGKHAIEAQLKAMSIC